MRSTTAVTRSTCYATAAALDVSVCEGIQKSAAARGSILANEALAARDLGDGAGDPARYVTLARFFAENITVQAGSLERTVMDSAEAVNGADAVLLG